MFKGDKKGIAGGLLLLHWFASSVSPVNGAVRPHSHCRAALPIIIVLAILITVLPLYMLLTVFDTEPYATTLLTPINTNYIAAPAL